MIVVLLFTKCFFERNRAPILYTLMQNKQKAPLNRGIEKGVCNFRNPGDKA